MSRKKKQIPTHSSLYAGIMSLPAMPLFNCDSDKCEIQRKDAEFLQEKMDTLESTLDLTDNKTNCQNFLSEWFKEAWETDYDDEFRYEYYGFDPTPRVKGVNIDEACKEWSDEVGED